MPQDNPLPQLHDIDKTRLDITSALLSILYKTNQHFTDTAPNATMYDYASTKVNDATLDQDYM